MQGEMLKKGVNLFLRPKMDHV